MIQYRNRIVVQLTKTPDFYVKAFSYSQGYFDYAKTNEVEKACHIEEYLYKFFQNNPEFSFVKVEIQIETTPITI